VTELEDLIGFVAEARLSQQNLLWRSFYWRALD